MNRQTALVLGLSLVVVAWRTILFSLIQGELASDPATPALPASLDCDDLRPMIALAHSRLLQQEGREDHRGVVGRTRGGVDGLLTASDTGCQLRSLLSRMQRLHLLFNEPRRLVGDLRWDAEEHAGLAIREEIEGYARARWGGEFNGRFEGKPGLVESYGRAEWWQDFAYGIQYLIEVRFRGQSGPTWLRVVDDRRFQLRVLEDPDVAPDTRVTIIAAVFNRASQLRKWAASLAQLAVAERGAFRVCLADFGSTDVRVRDLMKEEAAGVSCHIIDMAGGFSKTDGLNACLAWVATTPDELVFTTVIPLFWLFLFIPCRFIPFLSIASSLIGC